jgi:LacI family transcriptional regulator, galactose operon repressor
VSTVPLKHGEISDETRERVLRRMKELNYQPNLAARALVTGRTFSIGLVVPDLVHPFFAQVAKGISHQIRPKGYGLMISSSEEDPELEAREVAFLLSRQVDALILASALPSPASYVLCEQRRIPCVLVDRRFADLRANYVGVDDCEVGRVATEHLIDIGCRRIAHIRGGEVSPGVQRLHGYRTALENRGIAYDPEYVVLGRSSDDSADISGYDAMKKLLALDPRPDGVFCFNDPMAGGAMKAVLEQNLRIPEDVAMVGAGNVTYAELLRVPLTSVDQASESIGDRAARLALKLIGSKEPVRPRSVLLPPRLVVRESTSRTA